ncbi:MAG: hypothetical protein KME46_21445 [Brasilonema angustatum HA4187-MV1]|jgi:hypothetical protein|nr:hypothetical protein [Brasilonema angustatum HA4187-MV1]
MAATRALLSIEQTHNFIKELASRMDAKSGEKINIQMGKNSVYEGIVGQEPEMSKLTDTRVGVLRSAIDMDTPALGQKGEPSNIKQAIVIEKNDQEMFRFEKGQVLSSKLIEPEITNLQPAQIEGVEVVSQEKSAVVAFESITPFEVIKKEVEASQLREESHVRASTKQFIEHKEQQAQLQREENSKNWQWFQMSKIEEKQGVYSGSVSVEAIQDLAVSKAPVPENLRSERDGAVQKAEQFVIQVAHKALQQKGKELVPGVRTATVTGYTITQNEATGDLSIDKSNQTFLRHDTGKIEQSYRPDGVFKAKGNEVTHNRLLTKDLDNFDYIERKQLTRDSLAPLRDMVNVYGKEGKVPIETWVGGTKENAKIEKMQGRAFISEKAGIQIIESAKHLQVRDIEGNLQMKAYGDKVEKPFTREQVKDFQARYAVVQQLRAERSGQLQKQSVGMEMGR